MMRRRFVPFPSFSTSDRQTGADWIVVTRLFLQPYTAKAATDKVRYQNEKDTYDATKE